MKKSCLLGAVYAAIFSVISIQSHTSVVEYESKSAFVAAVGEHVFTQDLSTYAANTLLDGQLVDGITYNSTSSEDLVVESAHGTSVCRHLLASGSTTQSHHTVPHNELFAPCHPETLPCGSSYGTARNHHRLMSIGASCSLPYQIG